MFSEDRNTGHLHNGFTTKDIDWELKMNCYPTSGQPELNTAAETTHIETAKSPSISENGFMNFFELTAQEKMVVDYMEERRKNKSDFQSEFEDSSSKPEQAKRTENTTTGDLKVLKIAQTKINIRQFQKHQPSPLLQRQEITKRHIPTLPAINITDHQNQSRISSFNNYVNSSLQTNEGTSGQPNQESRINTVIDFIRVGSTRGQELVSNLIRSTPGKERPDEYRNTPTRKLRAKYEKLLIKPEQIYSEIAQINLRYKEIDEITSCIKQKHQNVNVDSIEEKGLINQQMKLMEEKEYLFRRESHLNTMLDIYDKKEKISNIKQQLDALTTIGTVIQH